MPPETYDNIPKDDVGTTVQDYVDDGAKKVTVTPNDNGTTCTVVVES
jgi:hypothetical protein